MASMTYVNKRHVRYFGWESVKPTIPEHVDRFAAYYAHEPVWGSLHIMLDESNYTDDDARFCMQIAHERGDVEGYELASILLRMSKTQRSKIGPMAERLYEEQRRNAPRGT